MYIIDAGDVISGQEAEVQIKDRETGELFEGFFIVSLDATADFNISEFRALGRAGTQNKVAGWTGSGTMEIYGVTSLFRQYLNSYNRTRIPPYFDIVVTNRDPASSIGEQTVRLGNCLLSSIPTASADVNSEILTETIEFVYDDFDLIDSFVLPEGAR